ncbi:nucleoside recognition domain-containing protein [Cellulosilyticum sp. I15G10I2]|uniref:nucleoside recognition domain-containing protein n=1 Tax=Cellulosilyticum sp. I15G10I2 TaxID=1892843 RepID=UPI00085C7EDE|nr:nucleoside recognition domain-containing protein [Cellulosilyticum sp. I15G10I2]
MSKKYIIAFGVIFIIVMLILSPNICIIAAKEGLLLWFNKILPSLLPFIILINILSQLNVMKGISTISSPLTQKIWRLPGSSLFAFVMGFVAGYPMGAKVIRQLLDSEALSTSEAQKLLCFSNNCGPLFIIGTVGTLMLNSSTIGYFLLLVHISSAILLSFIFSFYKSMPLNNHRKSHSSQKKVSFTFSYIFNEAVRNGMDTIVYIGGYIIFFSVIVSILKSSSTIMNISNASLVHPGTPSAFLGFITGLLELSNGVSMLCNSNEISLYLLALISFMISCGGICIYFQTSYVLGDCSISLIPYVIAKLMQGTLSFVLCYLLYPLFTVYTLKTPSFFEIRWLFILIGTITLFVYIIQFLNYIYFRQPQNSLKTKYTYNC